MKKGIFISVFLFVCNMFTFGISAKDLFGYSKPGFKESVTDILLNYWPGIIIGSFALFLMIGVPIIIASKQRKEKELFEKTQKEKYEQNVAKIKKIREMSVTDLLKENGLEEYCKLFEENKIENISIALKLKDNDLINMGISILGDRIKIISLLEKYQKILNNATATLKNVNDGVEIRINKHIFIWIGTFLFGYFGVDRFMRGQIGLGILKLVFDWCGIWALIDFIIALTKYSNYEEDFIFNDGYWA